MKKIDVELISLSIINTIYNNKEKIINRVYLSDFLGLSVSSVGRYIAKINNFLIENDFQLQIVYYYLNGYKLVNLQKLSDEEIKNIHIFFN